MNITYCSDYDDMSERAATLLMSLVREKPDLLLCAATGGSPRALYERLSREEPSLFSNLRIVKLDEWGGLSADDPASCEHYLQSHLLKPLNISPDRYIAFQNEAADPTAECERVQAKLEQQGPIDVCVLGLGTNGHLGLNEPAEFLQPYCHVSQLAESTRRHPMLQAGGSPPEFGLTLGMANLLSARKIILLVTGEGKAAAFEQLLHRKITTELPASLLWVHGNVECLVDSSVW